MNSLESLILGVTSNCQLACRMCAMKSYPMMKLHMFKKIVDWAGDGYNELIPDGNGEPLLHPDIVKMVEYVPTNVSMVTNGELLTDSKLDELINAGLTDIKISIEGSDARTHERIRVYGNWERVMRHARNAAKKIPVMVFSVLTKENVESLLTLPRMLADMGINKWAIWDCQDYGNVLNRDCGIKSIDKKIIKDLKTACKAYAVGLALHTGGEPKKCEAPQKQMYVHSNGDLSVCCIADDYVFGNMNDMSFEEARKAELSVDLHKMEGRHQKCREWLGDS